MTGEWLTFSEAAEIVRARIGGSVGRSEATLRAARSSGEVRFRNPTDPVLLMADDGLVGMDLRPGARRKSGVSPDGEPITYDLSGESAEQISKDDLLDWLRREFEERPTVSTRYPGDAALVDEGRKMIAAGMEKRAAARKLAARAEGAGTVESKVDRLRKML
jgi:hypothetical protein